MHLDDRAVQSLARVEGQPVHAPALRLAGDDEVQPVLETRTELLTIVGILKIDLEIRKFKRLHPREIAEGNPLRLFFLVDNFDKQNKNN